MVRRAEMQSGATLTCETKHKSEEHQEHRERRGIDPTPGTPDMGDLHQKDEFP